MRVCGGQIGVSENQVWTNYLLLLRDSWLTELVFDSRPTAVNLFEAANRLSALVRAKVCICMHSSLIPIFSICLGV
jgi:hypothetical protein